jgi:hypothetical protein
VATLPGQGRAAAAATGVVTLTALLAVLVHPALVPVLTGYALFAVHVVARRLSPAASVNVM